MFKKSYTKLLSLFLIFLIIFAVGLYFIVHDNNSAEGITAQQGEVIANSIAKNWNSSAILVVASKGSSMATNGVFTCWYYKYIDGPVLSNISQCLEIKVFSNETTEVRYNTSIGDKKPIFSWLIDSDEAYEISLSQTELTTFFNHRPKLDHMSLSNSTGNPIWYIEWAYDAGFDDPKWAEIHIDATTGEVLYVHADD